MDKFIKPFDELAEKLGHLMAVGGRVGCSWVSIKNWSTGKAKPSAEYRKKILELCDEFGIDFKFDNTTQKELEERVSDLESKLLVLSKPMMMIDNDNNIAPVVDGTVNQFKRDIEALTATLDITCKRVDILINFMQRDIEINMMKDDEVISKILEDLDNA